MKRKNIISSSFKVIPKSQKEIVEIKRNFLLSDIKHEHNVSKNRFPNLDFKENRIEFKVMVVVSVEVNQDEYGFEYEEEVLEDDLVEVDFFKEFEDALEIKLDNYCSKFLDELDKKSVYTVDDLEGFKKRQLYKVNERIEYLEKESDIEDKIKKIIIEYYNKLCDFIYNFKIEDYQEGHKLKFKLNKNQLIYLVQTMFDKRLISGIGINILYGILESHTQYFDNGKYQNMKGVRIQANKFINGHSSPEKSIKALSKIFDKNFFTTSE